MHSGQRAHFVDGTRALLLATRYEHSRGRKSLVLGCMKSAPAPAAATTAAGSGTETTTTTFSALRTVCAGLQHVHALEQQILRPARRNLVEAHGDACVLNHELERFEDASSLVLPPSHMKQPAVRRAPKRRSARFAGDSTVHRPDADVALGRRTLPAPDTSHEQVAPPDLLLADGIF